MQAVEAAKAAAVVASVIGSGGGSDQHVQRIIQGAPLDLPVSSVRAVARARARASTAVVRRLVAASAAPLLINIAQNGCYGIVRRTLRSQKS